MYVFTSNGFLGFTPPRLRTKLGSDYYFFGQRPDVELIFLNLLCRLYAAGFCCDNHSESASLASEGVPTQSERVRASSLIFPRLESTLAVVTRVPPEIRRLKPALNTAGCRALLHAIHLAKPRGRRGNQSWRPNKIQDRSITRMDSLS